MNSQAQYEVPSGSAAYKIAVRPVISCQTGLAYLQRNRQAEMTYLLRMQPPISRYGALYLGPNHMALPAAATPTMFAGSSRKAHCNALRPLYVWYHTAVRYTQPKTERLMKKAEARTTETLYWWRVKMENLAMGGSVECNSRYLSQSAKATSSTKEVTSSAGTSAS